VGGIAPEFRVGGLVRIRGTGYVIHLTFLVEADRSAKIKCITYPVPLIEDLPLIVLLISHRRAKIDGYAERDPDKEGGPTQLEAH
jgi:hypothetical protein